MSCRLPKALPTASEVNQLLLASVRLPILGRMTRGHYCLIGAGAAGLGALQVLLDEGFSVDCFERSDRVGGHWHSDYEFLHLITPRDSSGFDGFPMPSDYPLFPSRDQMRDYIMGFAAQHGLGLHIRFNTAVTSARPLDGNGLAGWEVTTRDASRGACSTPAATATPATSRASAYSSSEPGTPAATWPSTPPRPVARPTSQCATGWSSSPRRCSAGRGRSCRCSPACRSASRNA